MDLSFEHDRYEWNTLTQSQPARRRRWSFSVCVSSALHGVVAAVLCWPAAPIFVKPMQVARGEGGSATPSSVVLYVPNDLQLATATKPPLLSIPAPVQKKKQRTKLSKRTNVLEEVETPPMLQRPVQNKVRHTMASVAETKSSPRCRLPSRTSGFPDQSFPADYKAM